MLCCCSTKIKVSDSTLAPPQFLTAEEYLARVDVNLKKHAKKLSKVLVEAPPANQQKVPPVAATVATVGSAHLNLPNQESQNVSPKLTSGQESFRNDLQLFSLLRASPGLIDISVVAGSPGPSFSPGASITDSPRNINTAVIAQKPLDQRITEFYESKAEKK